MNTREHFQADEKRSNHRCLIASWNRAPKCRLLLILVLLAPFIAFGADISMGPLSQDFRLRNGAPIQLELELTNHSTRLIEGRIEATLLQRDQPSSVVRSQELFLSAGKRVVPMLLPPPPDSSPGMGLSMRLRFLGKNSVVELGEHRLGFVLDETEFVLGIVRTDRKFVDLDRARELSLRLESLVPKRPSVTTTDGTVPLDARQLRSAAAGFFSPTCTTHAPSLTVSAMPVEATGWCAYDVVSLDGSAFAAASEKQLTALSRWIAGGGSAVIFANERLDGRLSERHLDFLRRIGGEEFTISADGLLVADTRSPRRIAHGLGRLLVTPAQAADAKEFDARSWRSDVAWLWKLNPGEVEHVAANGSWAAYGTRADGDFRADFERVDFEFDRWLHGAAMGYEAATPDKPRPLPLLLVSFLLGGLLLLAGPGEWFILGWLRRRRWTWVAFPVLCIVATGLAAHLSSRYLGHVDRTGAIRISDVGSDDTVLREVRYDLLLPAKDGQWSMDVRDGVQVKALRVWNPADLADSAIPDSTRGIVFSDQGAAEGQWNGPGHFTFRRAVRQWSPVMNQTVRFPDAKDDSGIDWRRICRSWKYVAALQTKTLPNYDMDGWHVMFGQLESSSSKRWVAMANREGVGVVQEPGTRSRLHGEIAADSRMNYDLARWLVNQRMSTRFDKLLAGHSPVLQGPFAAIARAPEPITALVWRETAHEIHIYRRYFSQAELDAIK